jgi:hypothetical protein
MKQHALRAAIVAAAFALALAGPSCTSSEVIATQQGEVQVLVSSTSAPAGYPWGRITVSQMTFRPVPPGPLTAPYALFLGGQSFDMSGSATLEPVRVSALTYEIQPFDAGFELNVDPVQPPSPVGQSGVCDNGNLLSLRTKNGEETSVAPACQFVVTTSGLVQVNIAVDGAGLAALLASKYNCGSNTYTPPTSAEVLPFLTFQCGP